MSRIWLLRGGAAAIFGVLVGAWAVGLAGFSGSISPPDKIPAPASPEDSQVWDIVHSTVMERAKPRRTRDAERSEDALAEPTPTTSDEPTDAPSSSPTSPSSSPTTDQPSPSDPPSSNPPSQTPSNPPSNPPSTPADECTDLGDVIDCVLDPITGRP